MPEDKPVIVAFRTTKHSAERLKILKEAIRLKIGLNTFGWEPFFMDAVETAYAHYEEELNQKGELDATKDHN